MGVRMAREIPYEPIDKPKRVTFQRMQEILAKRNKEAQENMAHLKREMWFASRLNDHSKEVFLGDTTREVRLSRVRGILNKCLLADETVGRRQGREITYREIFLEIYGEPL